ncbi:MAG: hypothetical protein V2I33_19535, partial [Kangiellaceae bacterium]|nr:hypothetical protein [Kangiellaceae bacterium]
MIQAQNLQILFLCIAIPREVESFPSLLSLRRVTINKACGNLVPIYEVWIVLGDQRPHQFVLLWLPLATFAFGGVLLRLRDFFDVIFVFWPKAFTSFVG